MSQSMWRVGTGWQTFYQPSLFLDSVARRSPVLSPGKVSTFLSLRIIGSISSGHLLKRVPQNGFLPPSPNRWERAWLCHKWSSSFCKCYESMWKLLLLVAEALSYHATLLSASSISGVLWTRCQSWIDGKFLRNSWRPSPGNTTSITVKKTSWNLYLMF